MAPTSLPHLPDEVLATILTHLDPYTIVSLHKTSRRFLSLVDEPLIWRSFCKSHFRYWSDRPRIRQLLADPLSTEWRALYASRHTNSQTTRKLLKRIVDDPVSRSDRIQEVVERGYESKDELIRLYYASPVSPDHLAQRYWSHVALGCLHRTRALEEWNKIKYRPDIEDRTERGLAAFDMFILGENKTGDIDDVLDSLNSYVDAVRQAHPDIDSLTPRQRAILIAKYLREREWVGIHENRDYHSLDNMFLGVAVTSKLRDSLPLVSAVIYCYVCRRFNLRAQPCNYPMHVHALVQAPIGFDLDGEPLPTPKPPPHQHPPDRQPLSDRDSAEKATTRLHRQAIGSTTATRSTASTSSTSPPFEPSPTTDMYMDPFQTHEPVSLTYLQNQIRFMGLANSAAESDSHLRPATHRDLITRSAHNMINSASRHAGPLAHPISFSSALYAAYFALVFFPSHPATLRTHLSELTQHFLHAFDHDIHIFRNHVLPLTAALPDAMAYRNLAAQLLHSELEQPNPKFRGSHYTHDVDSQPDTPPAATDPLTTLLTTSPPHPSPSSTQPPHEILYSVGQIFRHRRQNYLAVIYGWDSTCRMSSQWISMNQVDRLPQGRHQPFYNAYVADDESTRYVAQENVVVVFPPSSREVVRGESGGDVESGDRAWNAARPLTREMVEGFGIEVGRWFKRFDWNAGRFVSNVRAEYPDD